MKKNKLDLEILKKKSKKFNKLATKTKNYLIDSINYIADRISFKKQKTLQAENDGVVIENSKEIERNLVEKPENESPKVETISISLNIVEYAPKIFNKLRKLDGVGFKQLLE